MTHRDNDIDIGGDSILIAVTAGSTSAELPLLDVLIPFQQYTVARGTTSTVTIASGTKDLSERFPVGTKIQTSTAGVATDDLEVASVAFATSVTTVTMTTAGVTAAIDGIALRKRPKRVAVSADVTDQVSFSLTNGAGTVTLANGFNLHRNGGPLYVKSLGRTHINVIGITGGLSGIHVTPLND